MKIRGIAVAAIILGAMGVSATNADANLINNGDFSAGNVDFTTGYIYVAPAPNALYPEGDYTIGTNPNDVHDLWVDEPTNPTMLLVNGATGTPQPTIWQEDGVAGTGSYDFSAVVQDLCCDSGYDGNVNAPSTILFEISNDGGATWTTILSYTTSPGAGTTYPQGDSGVLENMGADFSDTGTFDIRAIDSDTAAGGNDFGLTDLSLTAVPEPLTLSLFGVGLIGLGALRRHKARKVA